MYCVSMAAAWAAALRVAWPRSKEFAMALRSRSPPPAREARGGEGSGVGGAACSKRAISFHHDDGASVVPPPRPRSLRSRGRPSPPTGGRVKVAGVLPDEL